MFPRSSSEGFRRSALRTNWASSRPARITTVLFLKRFKSMPTSRQSLGKLGEEIAVNFLKNKGYRILARNFKTSRFGEIDIVAQDYSKTLMNADQNADLRGLDTTRIDADKRGINKILPKFLNFIRNSLKFVIRRGSEATMVFIEVKTKSSDEFGLPEEEFTFYKKQHFRRAIQDYFWAKKIETNNWRIDLIAVDFTENEERPEIRHHEGVN